MPDPKDRFQPDPSAAALPQTGQGLPGVQQASVGQGPKNAFDDPNAEKFVVEFWIGAASRQLIMAAPNKESAMLGAYCVAARMPEVHTFGVWRKTGPEVDDVGECVCYVPISNMVASCAKVLEAMTGKKTIVPAVPIITAEAGFDTMAKQLKEDQRRRK